MTVQHRKKISWALRKSLKNAIEVWKNGAVEHTTKEKNPLRYNPKYYTKNISFSLPGYTSRDPYVIGQSSKYIQKVRGISKKKINQTEFIEAPILEWKKGTTLANLYNTPKGQKWIYQHKKRLTCELARAVSELILKHGILPFDIAGGRGRFPEEDYPTHILGHNILVSKKGLRPKIKLIDLTGSKILDTKGISSHPASRIQEDLSEPYMDAKLTLNLFAKNKNELNELSTIFEKEFLKHLDKMHNKGSKSRLREH